MSGIFNHPKMPLVAGGLVLTLLGGVVYSSSQDDTPAASKATTAAVLPAAKHEPVMTPAVASHSQTAPVKMAAPVVPTAPAAGTQSAAQPVAAPKPHAPKPQAPKPVMHPAPVPMPPVLPLPLPPAPPRARLLVNPIFPAKAVPKKPAPAKTPLVYAPTKPAVAPAKSAEAIKPVAKPVTAPKQVAIVTHPAYVPHHTEHHRRVIKESHPAAVSHKAEKRAAPSSGDFTEIKVTKPNLNLSLPQPDAVVSHNFTPSLVAASGNQAWVKISPARTIVVHPGDNVPGIGKVLNVTNGAVKTDKGQLTGNKE